jgi:hypothetical protein
MLIPAAGAAIIVGGGYLIWRAVKNTVDQPEDAADYTDKLGKVADKLGKTKEQVEKAVHQVKRAMSRNAAKKNPDVMVNPKNGDVRPKTPDGLGDSIGNIWDHL